ncbi:MAG: hypothetical protein AAB488_02455 [Patescibacteria group bacterium]
MKTRTRIVHIKCHLPEGSRIIRVVANNNQIKDLLKEDSSLWPILDLRLKEKLGRGGEFTILFGKIIFGLPNEKVFTEQILEVDLSDVSEIPDVSFEVLPSANDY